MSLRKKALDMHRDKVGKIEICSKVPLINDYDLSLAYTPGVAEPCREIEITPENAYLYTTKGNMVAVVTDGTAVLGLGNIGPEAALPVMEGKAVLFKAFAGIDAFPICLSTTDVKEIVQTVKYIEPGFGGINLEDISAPRCFEVERLLKACTNIPIFHDDQHGTAIVAAAGLINALKIVDKTFNKIKVVISGAGAAGIAIAKHLINLGVENILVCDRYGSIFEGREVGMNSVKHEIARLSNKDHISAGLSEIIRGADVFIGVSGPGLVTPQMIKSMASRPVVMAMANPDPEIMPELAKEAGAQVVCTGRSDFPNQINNVLAFPGVFRGALDVRSVDINEEMKIAATYALADLIQSKELSEDYVIPHPFDRRVAPAVAAAVAKAACESGSARVIKDPEEVEEHTRQLATRPPI